MTRPDDSPLAADERIGRYRVKRQLGAGGMGVVYEAIDEDLERAVALKVLPTSVTRDEERRARFLREARAAAAVTHRSIAVIHEVGEDDDRVYLAMELVSGETLADRIDRGPVGVDEAMAIALPIAEGLAKAHGAGIVHRDLKPNNVMIDEDGEVKILDFGLAKRFGDDPAESSVEVEEAATVSAITEAGRVLGTPGYMAPEQAEGLPVAPPADVFAFGTTLYEMLSGRMAFGGASTARRIAATLEAEPAPLPPTDVPPEVIELVTACLAKDPMQRPADGRALVERLSQLLPERKQSLRPPAPSARLQVDGDASGVDATLVGGAKTLPAASPSTRKPWWLIGVAVVVLGAVVVWSQRNQATDAKPPTPAPALDLDASTACPIFEVTGQKGPPGRLGAAAAARACSVWQLYAAEQTTVVPAELLDLPTLAVDDFPVRPFAAEDARSRSLAAAKKSPLMLDGAVVLGKEGMTATVRLFAGGESEPRATATATDRLHARAVRRAVRKLAKSLGRSESVAPPSDVRMVIDCPDVACALDAFQAQSAALSDKDLEASCQALVNTSKLLAAARAEVCGHPEVGEDRMPTWPPGLRKAMASLPKHGQLYWRTFLQLQRLTPELAQTQAEELAEVGATLPEGVERASLAAAEGVLRFRATKPDDATALVSRANQMDPKGCEGRVIAYQLSTETGNRRPLARAGNAWCPTSSDLWEYRYFIEEGDDRDLEDMRTAFYLTDGAARIGIAFGQALLKEGRIEEARAIAARYASSGPRAVVGHYLLARVEIASGRLDAGLERLRGELGRLERLGEATALHADWSAAVALVDFARLVGRSAEMADFILERFLLTDTPALLGSGTLTLAYIATFASPSVAKRAATRLRELSETGKLWKVQEMEPYLEGMLAMQRGDARTAAERWRTLVPKQVFRELLVAAVFDEADEPDIAWAIGEADLERGGATVGLQHALHAKRALARGDRVRAKALAKLYVDTWGTADARVILLDEMHELLREE